MWGYTRRRTPVTRVVKIPEYDRSLITYLVLARPGLTHGRTALSSDQGLGAVIVVIVGHSSEDLEWLETATTALGGDVLYMPIRSSDNRNVKHETAAALADGIDGVAHAIGQAAESNAILTGERSTDQPETDRELRRITEQGRSIRQRALDRDRQLVQQHTTGHHADAALLTERAADRRRYHELRDEYQLMNGGEPTIWPF